MTRDDGGRCPGGGDGDPTETSAPTIPMGTAAVVDVASRGPGATVSKPQLSSRRGHSTTPAAISAGDRDNSGGGEGARTVGKGGEASPGEEKAVSATTVAPATVLVGSSRANKALVELRSELRRHLAAVAHVLDGGRHLQEATRVMREIEKFEALDRLEAEVSPPPKRDRECR